MRSLKWRKLLMIRRYESQDIEEILTLFYETVHTVNAKDYTVEQLQVWAPLEVDKERFETSLSKHYTLVSVHEHQIVGFADLREDGYLDRLYVHHLYQGQGIATQLLQALESYANEMGLKQLVTHASITARPFFEKRGFEVKKEQQVLRGDQVLTNYQMEKSL